MVRKPGTRRLEAALGHTFRRAELLELALTHASLKAARKPGQDNERLEFLGDRVLGLAIAELLHEADPTASEGHLARRFNQLVRGETCAEVAREIGLAGELRLGESERESGGQDKGTILAGAMEAVLGAVFLDRGYDAARAVVHRHWYAKAADLPARVVDAKSALQEWAQARGLRLPRYLDKGREGPDHAPQFTAEVRIEDEWSAVGRGANKRAAEQAAAAALLRRAGVWAEETTGK